MEQKLLLQDLANLLAEKEGISKRQAETFVRAFFDITEEALLQDNYVKITGFGTAKLVEVSERESVNIHTGERFQIQGHSKVSFTPDPHLRDLINRPFAHFSTITLNDETTEEELAEADKLDVKNMPSTEANPPNKEENSTSQTETTIETSTKEDAQEEENTLEATILPKVSVEENEKETKKEDHKPLSTPLSEATKTETAVEEKNAAEEISEKRVQEKTVPPLENKDENNFTISTATADIQQTQSDDVTNIKGSILVKTEESNKHSQTNYWKVGFLIVATIFLLQIGYCAGMKGLFDTLLITKSTPSPQPKATTKAEVALKPQPSSPPVVQPQTSPTPPAAPEQPTVAPVTERKPSPRAEKPKLKAPKSAAPQPKAATPQPMAKPTSKKLDFKKAAAQYQQLPKGKMLIVGTESLYQFAIGDNIYHLAKRTYGSKEFAPYIILYNNLDEPDNVPIGKMIKLPKLIDKAAIANEQ